MVCDWLICIDTYVVTTQHCSFRILHWDPGIFSSLAGAQMAFKTELLAVLQITQKCSVNFSPNQIHISMVCRAEVSNIKIKQLTRLMFLTKTPWHFNVDLWTWFRTTMTLLWTIKMIKDSHFRHSDTGWWKFWEYIYTKKLLGDYCLLVFVRNVSLVAPAAN